MVWGVCIWERLYYAMVFFFWMQIKERGSVCFANRGGERLKNAYIYTYERIGMLIFLGSSAEFVWFESRVARPKRKEVRRLLLGVVQRLKRLFLLCLLV